ncbi:MAG TPA: AMP-binding protein [Actinomycetota bacterium]|nr:AMP-binding protein [Actinomycetota bacterium]
MTDVSYVSGPSERPLLPRTIGQELDHARGLHGGLEALVARHQGLRYTYAELHAEAERVARALMALGVRAGDRVGIWSPNRAEWVITQYGAAKAGAILVNVNPAYKTQELGFILDRAGVSVLVSARAFRSTDYLAMLEQVRPDLPGLRHVVLLGEAPGPWATSWDAFLARADETSLEDLREREATLDFDDPINIQYTSGTTGQPKGATLSHHNILNNGFFVGERERLGPSDRICVPVPFYHCFGMVMGNLAALTHGSCVVIPSESFDAGACLAAVQEERCTALYGVPTMFIAELDHADFHTFDLTSLRTGIMAGSPCPVEVMKQVVDRMHMTEVTICYGMTETSPVSFQSLPDDDLDRRVSTVGAIHPHVEAKIVDPGTGRTNPRGQPGELCTRGYLVMLGYWNDPNATREAVDRARWMHTGDLAEMCEDGYVNIVGRIKDMVIRGGENIYPREIEEFLYTHPTVADVQVIGVPDERYGEEICAWVRLKEGAQVTGEELRIYCKGKIATYKIPRYVLVVDGFPMTVTGKVQKFRMRELSIRELGLEKATSATTA